MPIAANAITKNSKNIRICRELLAADAPFEQNPRRRLPSAAPKSLGNDVRVAAPVTKR